MAKYSVDDLKDMAYFFNLEKNGDKAHIIDRLVEFIQKPKDLGPSKETASKKKVTKKKTAKKVAGSKRKLPSEKKEIKEGSDKNMKKKGLSKGQKKATIKRAKKEKISNEEITLNEGKMAMVPEIESQMQD